VATATALYTPQVLALATGLAAYPLSDDLPLQAGARSKSCGSTLTLGLATDAEGRIARLGLKAQACAIGQAAAAIFAQAAGGRNGAEIAAAGHALGAWLAGAGPRPDWPGLELLEPARAYPARHGAIMLAWNAARELLPTSVQPR
jgi:NifU-like protein involved in Fe-S cluster formation